MTRYQAKQYLIYENRRNEAKAKFEQGKGTLSDYAKAELEFAKVKDFLDIIMLNESKIRLQRANAELMR